MLLDEVDRIKGEGSDDRPPPEKEDDLPGVSGNNTTDHLHERVISVEQKERHRE